MYQLPISRVHNHSSHSSKEGAALLKISIGATNKKLVQMWISFFISKEGKIYRGRNENQCGSHCKQHGMNMKFIGICLKECYEF